MTYQEFKYELCIGLLHRRGYENRDIRLFEKNGTYSDAESLSLLRRCNMDLNGNSNFYVMDDILSVSWLKYGNLYEVHWKVRELYRRYQLVGWQWTVPDLLQYVKICDRLVVRPFAVRDKIWELDTHVCRCEGDIVLMLCLRIDASGEDEAVTEVTREMAAQWNIPDDQLLLNALHRSNKLMPALMYHEAHRYHLTTERGTTGALAFFYPGIRDWVAAIVKTDYYVGFTGDQEALIHSVFYKRLNELQNEIHAYNSVVGRCRCLTNRIYRYDSICGRLMEL